MGRLRFLDADAALDPRQRVGEFVFGVEHRSDGCAIVGSEPGSFGNGKIFLNAALLRIDRLQGLLSVMGGIAARPVISIFASIFNATLALSLESNQARRIQNLHRIGAEIVEKAIIVAIHP
jgi:hypothetical protein